MCQTADNSLKGNLRSQSEMLLGNVVTLDRMPKLAADAENAERLHRKLMKQAGWTPEELFKNTGYRILTENPLINH